MANENFDLVVIGAGNACTTVLWKDLVEIKLILTV